MMVAPLEQTQIHCLKEMQTMIVHTRDTTVRAFVSKHSGSGTVIAAMLSSPH